MGAMDFNTDTSPENPKGGSWGGPIPSSAIQKEGSKWHMGETQNRGSEGRVLNKKVVCRDCLWWFYHKRFGEYLVLLFLSFTHIHLDCSELSLWRYTNVFFRFETRHHRVSSSKIVHCSLPKNRSAATWADSLESLRSPIGSAYTWHCWRSPSLRKLRHLRLRAGRYQAVESLVQIKSLTCWMSMSPFNSGNTNIQLWHLWKPPWVNGLFSSRKILSFLYSFSEARDEHDHQNHWKRSPGGGFSLPVIGETIEPKAHQDRIGFVMDIPRNLFTCQECHFFLLGVVPVVEIGGRYIMMPAWS